MPARQGPPPARRWRAPAAVVAVALAAAVVLAACGGDKGPDASSLSAAGRRGQAIAAENGCASCHTTTGARATGPTWKGLAGSKVELAGGTTTTATDAYLERSIRDPKAQVVSGFAGGIMPSNDLTEAEIADVIAYLHDLAAPAGKGSNDQEDP